MRRHLQQGLPRVAPLTIALCVLWALGLTACTSSLTDQYQSGTGESLADRVESGLSIRAQRGSNKLDIQRTTPAGTRPSNIQKDTWSVFVYLCGSDLETRAGSATKDLDEMVRASGSKNVSFVVETGGAKEWRSKAGSSKLHRYLIQNGSITEVEKSSAADMGDPNTLADFLSWGLSRYPADRMGVILWDHGGGSISGVCFDERNSYDSLMLRELDTAFAKVNSKLWQKFDFVGFDACLMGTLETANVLAPYADYMIASQETEPGTGWEYQSIGSFLAKNPACTVAELGEKLCDSYMESLPRNVAGTATLSVTDLSEVDDLIQSFYGFSQEMYESGSDRGTLAAMTRGIQQAENYGNNNWIEGYSNMVDLGGMVDACADVTPSADDVRAALKRAIVYQVRGRGHVGSSGLSVYYPLSVGSSKELSAFQTVALNPSYLSYVDRLAHGATYGTGSQYTSYSGNEWYDDDDLWSMVLDEDTLSLLLGLRSVDPRWEYVDEHDGTSDLITFAEKPHVDDKGVFSARLDAEGIENTASAGGFVAQKKDDGSTLTLGETFDVYADWDAGTIEDGFNGKWLSLPDGQNLCLSVAELLQDQVVYSAPITLNGDACYLRMSQDLDEEGKVTVEGVWRGADESGYVDRSCTQLAKDDVIVPLYDEDGSVTGKPYTLTEDTLAITYGDLPVGSYTYAFKFTDVFGDHALTDTVQLDVEDDGIYFVE